MTVSPSARGPDPSAVVRAVVSVTPDSPAQHMLEGTFKQFGSLKLQYGLVSEDFDESFLAQAEILIVHVFGGKPKLRELIPSMPNLKWV